MDFRVLNSVNKFNSYPLPIFEETVSTLHGSKYFTVLHFYSGFWQLNIAESHKEKTTFTVPSGHHEFQRLPFGLANSPANFQRLMDTVLRDLIGPECWAFDDIVIFSRSIEHVQRLENVLQRFKAASLQLQPGKCLIAQPKVQYLGYVLSEEEITASPDKIKAVTQYPTPNGVKHVRAFIGLASSYRRLVPDFAKLAKPLMTRERTSSLRGVQPKRRLLKV